MAAEGQDEKQQQCTAAPDPPQLQQRIQEQLQAAQQQLREMEQTWLAAQQQQHEMQQQVQRAQQQALQVKAQQQQQLDGRAFPAAEDNGSREAKRYVWRMEMERLQHETVLRKQQERLLEARDICLQWLACHQQQRAAAAAANATGLPPLLSGGGTGAATGADTKETTGYPGSGAAAARLKSVSASSMLSDLLLPLLQEALDLCSSGSNRSGDASAIGDAVSSCFAAATTRESQHTDAAAAAARHRFGERQQVICHEEGSRRIGDDFAAGRTAAAPETPPAAEEGSRERRQSHGMLQQQDWRSSSSSTAVLVHPTVVSPLQLVVSGEKGNQPERVKRRQQQHQEKPDAEELLRHIEGPRETRQRSGEPLNSRSHRSRVSPGESSRRGSNSSSNRTPHSYSSNSSYVGSRIQSTREITRQEEDTGRRREGEERGHSERTRLLRVISDSSRTEDSYSSRSQDTSSPSPRPAVRVSAWRGRPAFVPRLNLTGDSDDEDGEDIQATAALVTLPQQQQEQHRPELLHALLQEQQLSSPHRISPEVQQQQQQVQQQQEQSQQQHQQIQQLQQRNGREITPHLQHGGTPRRQQQRQHVLGEKQQQQQQHVFEHEHGKTGICPEPRERKQRQEVTHVRTEEFNTSDEPCWTEKLRQRQQQQRHTGERQQQHIMLRQQQQDVEAETQQEQQEKQQERDEIGGIKSKEAVQQEVVEHCHAGSRGEAAAEEYPTFRKEEMEAANGGDRGLLSGRAAGDKQEQQPAQREQCEVMQHERAVPEEASAFEGLLGWRSCLSQSRSRSPTFSSLPSSYKSMRALEQQRLQQQARQTRYGASEEQSAAVAAAETQQQEGTDNKVTMQGEQGTTPCFRPAPCTAEVALLTRSRVEATWRLQQQLQQHQQVQQQQQGQQKQHVDRERYACGDAEEAAAAAVTSERTLGSVLLETVSHVDAAGGCISCCRSSGRNYDSQRADRGEICCCSLRRLRPSSEKDCCCCCCSDENGLQTSRRRQAAKNSAVSPCLSAKSATAVACTAASPESPIAESRHVIRAASAEEEEEPDATGAAVGDVTAAEGSTLKKREQQQAPPPLLKRFSRDISHTVSDSGNCCPRACDSDCGSRSSSNYSSCKGDVVSDRSHSSSGNSRICEGSSGCQQHQQNDVATCSSSMYFCSGGSRRNMCKCTQSDEGLYVCCYSGSDPRSSSSSSVRVSTHSSSGSSNSSGSTRGLPQRTIYSWKRYLAEDQVAVADSNCGEETQQQRRESPLNADRVEASSVCRGNGETGRPQPPSPSSLSSCSSHMGTASPVDTETLVYFDSPSTAAVYGNTSLPSCEGERIGVACGKAELLPTTDGNRLIFRSTADAESHSQQQQQQGTRLPEEQQNPQKEEEKMPLQTEMTEQLQEIHKTEDREASEDNNQQVQQQQDVRCRCRRNEDKEQQQSGKLLQYEGVHHQCLETQQQQNETPPHTPSREQQQKQHLQQQQHQEFQEELWRVVIGGGASRRVPAAAALGVASEAFEARDLRAAVMETRQQSETAAAATEDSHGITSLAFVAVAGTEQLRVGGEKQQAVQELLKKSGLNPELLLENRVGCKGRTGSRCHSSCGRSSSSNMGADVYFSETSRHAVVAIPFGKRAQCITTTSSEFCDTSESSSNSSSCDEFVQPASEIHAARLRSSSAYTKAADEEAAPAAAAHSNTPISRLPTTASTDEGFSAATTRFQGLLNTRETSVMLQQLREDGLSQLWQQHHQRHVEEHQHDQQQQHQPKHQTTQQELLSILDMRAATFVSLKKDLGIAGLASGLQEKASWQGRSDKKQTPLNNSKRKEEAKKIKEARGTDSCCFSFSAQEGIDGFIFGDATAAADETAAVAVAGEPGAQTAESVVDVAVAGAAGEGSERETATQVTETAGTAEKTQTPNTVTPETVTAVAAAASSPVEEEEDGDNGLREAESRDAAAASERREASRNKQEWMSEVLQQTAERQEKHTVMALSPTRASRISNQTEEDEEETDGASASGKRGRLYCVCSPLSADADASGTGAGSVSCKWIRKKQPGLSETLFEENRSDKKLTAAAAAARSGCCSLLLPDTVTIEKRRTSCGGIIGEQHQQQDHYQSEKRVSSLGKCSNRATEMISYSYEEGNNSESEEEEKQGYSQQNAREKCSLTQPLPVVFGCGQPHENTRKSFSTILKEKKQNQDQVKQRDSDIRGRGKTACGQDTSTGTLQSIGTTTGNTHPQRHFYGEEKKPPFFSTGLTMITSSGFSPAATSLRTATGQQHPQGNVASSNTETSHIGESSKDHDEEHPSLTYHHQIKGVHQTTADGNRLTQSRCYHPLRQHKHDLPHQPSLMHEARAAAPHHRCSSEQVTVSKCPCSCCCCCKCVENARCRMPQSSTQSGNILQGRGVTTTTDIPSLHYRHADYGLIPTRTSRSLSPCCMRRLQQSRMPPSYSRKIGALLTRKHFPQTAARTDTAGRRLDTTHASSPKIYNRSTGSAAPHDTFSSFDEKARVGDQQRSREQQPRRCEEQLSQMMTRQCSFSASTTMQQSLHIRSSVASTTVLSNYYRRRNSASLDDAPVSHHALSSRLVRNHPAVPRAHLESWWLHASQPQERHISFRSGSLDSPNCL